MQLRLYNSLTRKLEDFRPITPGTVLQYTCGPTVYFFQSLGNFRTFTLSDFLLRTLQFNGFKVRFIMNLTDVGHLTGDNAGDADTGDDRLELAAEKEGKSAQEIAEFYTKQFLEDFDKLNLVKPVKFTKASDYIQEQIELVKTLEMKGYTYKTTDGVYFDTSKFKGYTQMSGFTPADGGEGARIEPNPEKKNPMDFALWKKTPSGQRRWQEWDSPWGVGFPGWHLECSAMVLNELGDTIDIHIGGEDHKTVHHPNEIAQSQCATGKKPVNYWVHGTHLQVDGGKMGKSLGNIYTVTDVENKGFHPLSLRYFYMTAHYRSALNFTWTALQSSDNALKKLYTSVSGLRQEENAQVDEVYLAEFTDAINDDLNIPKAMAVVWDMMKSDLEEGTKLVSILKFDEVLGLNIEEHVGLEIPKKVQDLAQTRRQYRKKKIRDKADPNRKPNEELGSVVEDVGEDIKMMRKI